MEEELEPYDIIKIRLPDNNWYDGIYLSSSGEPKIVSTYVRVGGDYFSHMALEADIKAGINKVSHKILKVKKKRKEDTYGHSKASR